MKQIMNQAFHQAHEFTVQWEDGLQSAGSVVLHPQKHMPDAHLGLSRAWLIKILNDTHASRENNEENLWHMLEPVEVMQLLHTHFWKKLACTALPLPLSIFLYDTAIHIGVSPAMRILQDCCNIVGEAHLDTFNPTQLDGINGKKTQALARALAECNLDFYTARMCVRQRVHFYAQYVKNTPQLQKSKQIDVHMAMWKQRCQALLEYLAMLERDF